MTAAFFFFLSFIPLVGSWEYEAFSNDWYIRQCAGLLCDLMALGAMIYEKVSRDRS